MSAIELALFAVVLLVIGGAIGFYFARLGASAGEARADELERDLEKYRAEVTEHFGKTAEHFRSMGQQYRDLYDHLAAGSASLCNLDGPDTKPLFPLPELTSTPDTSEDAAAAAGTDSDAEAVDALATSSVDEAVSDEPAVAAEKDDEDTVELAAEADEAGTVEADGDLDVDTETEESVEAGFDDSPPKDFVVETEAEEAPRADNVVELIQPDEQESGEEERSIR